MDTFFQLSNETIVEINIWKLDCMYLPQTNLEMYYQKESIALMQVIVCVLVIVFIFLERFFIRGGQRKTVGAAQVGENVKLWN